MGLALIGLRCVGKAGDFCCRGRGAWGRLVLAPVGLWGACGGLRARAAGGGVRKEGLVLAPWEAECVVKLGARVAGAGVRGER